MSPATVTFRYSAYGKPDLARRPAERPLRFNVSHSGSWALIAVTLDQRIGVDVEYVRPLENLDRLARTCLSDSELDVFQSLPESARQLAFFHAWTRKEAFVKACGAGLSQSLKDFTVNLLPGEPARLWRAAGTESVADWSLFAFEPASGHVAAGAVDRPDPCVAYFELAGGQ